MGLPWYKRDPRAELVEMQRLTLEQRGAYATLIDLIHVHDGGVDDGVPGVNVTGVDRLFNSGKIKPRVASPSRGRSTRVAQDRGAVHMATNPDCVAPSTAGIAIRIGRAHSRKYGRTAEYDGFHYSRRTFGYGIRCLYASAIIV